MFAPEEYWWDEEEKPKEDWSLSGTSLLDDKGALDLRQAIMLGDATRPQRFTIEADVTDSSHRHVASRASAVAHPRTRYAGLRMSGGWVAVGKPTRVELGVIDREGKSVSGATATARLTRVDWRHQRVRVAGGAVRSEWRKTETEVARCSVKSETRPVACELNVPGSGEYEVVAEVDGHAGGSGSLWAWRDGDTEQARGPSRGSAIPMVADKASYAPGDTARILVRNPYPAAIAVLTLEQGELISHQSKRVDSSAAVFDVPMRAEHAPHVHAAVTLLPIGAEGEQAVSYRVGALRLPVASKNSRLTVTTKSTESSYRPGTEAEIQLEVSDGNKPEAHAEVALAVVDEGVLRLTGFRAEDPTDALRPPQALSFLVRSSHASLAELLERSHVAGDGGGDELGSLTDARRRFVETALWKPQVRTDAHGRARLRFRLPDNLTEFRIMAVAVDDEGKGGASEASFTVNKPLMIDPIVPRFAHRGDAFEAAAMVHNQSGKPFKGAVRIRGERIPIELAADTRQRVGMSMRFDRPGETKLAFAMEDEKGKVVDAAERKLRIELPGIESHPQIADAFAGAQTIALAIPEDAIFEPGAKLTVQAGQHLWPELGARLEYLLDYPYGCVEQTTSSTLPLIAARDILPRIGVHQYGEQFFRERINSGLERLNKMRTSSGGLAYWPGGDEPSVYGTAYAIRAVLRAKQAGIEPPEGLLEGMKKYLRDNIGSAEQYLRPSIAQSLAEAGNLPPGMLDSLYADRTEQDVFAKASIAIALSHAKGQDDRVKALLDDIEKQFDEQGRLKTLRTQNRYGYFESDDRTIAQVAIAFARLRKSSRLLPLLIRDIAEERGYYTTQGLAYGLLAIADHLGNAPDRGASVAASLDGRALESKDLGAGGMEIAIPLADLAGKKRKLELTGPAGVAIGFRVSAQYRSPLPSQEGGENWQSAAKGPDVFRVFTTPEGDPIDMSKVKAGGLVRVTLLLRVPGDDKTYLAVTDRIAAGFEPVDPDLATVASAPEIRDTHPF
ncbi:MAG TPA: alpha-2-macroglobulin family protein, partial [Polyangiaceae bacterium]|nr:alpha-2-macroglobulin family protein [Polyangiaceae bacterium]